VLTKSRQDTSRVMTLTRLSTGYSYYSTDTSIKLAQQALRLARRLNFAKGESRALEAISLTMRVNGDFPQALGYALKALAIAQTRHEPAELAWRINMIGLIYFDMGEPQKALHYFQQAKQIFDVISRIDGIVNGLNNITDAYISLGLLDSARFVNRQAQQAIKLIPKDLPRRMALANNSGRLAGLGGNQAEALGFYQQAISFAVRDNNIRVLSTTQLYIAEVYNQLHQLDSSLHYAQLALANGQRLDFKSNTLKISNFLAQLYTSLHKPDSALHYLELARVANDSLFGVKKFQQLQLLVLQEQQRQQEQQVAQQAFRSNVKLVSVLAGLIALVLLTFIQYRNNRHKHRVNLELAKSLTDLRTTQAQLIQKEKMASLGELTAGIAHEIQNPLNFVNNFSEVSSELVAELKEEAQAGRTDDVLALADDLEQNLEKITLHGQRASGIVKGMLEHARTTTGKRQPTDLNALCEEYMRLAYHGFRAKDKDFNAELKTNFDPDLGLVEVVPQEMGRVLLNLFNNAFYALNQRRSDTGSNETYKPSVWVSTHQEEGQIVIGVKDNGTGMPESVRQKIFQPFFTTKPTGAGTGLGLSLSYDIVTKGHNGTLAVSSQEGQGTEFSITLPTAKQG
jgi:signal transduction histidine kinase